MSATENRRAAAARARAKMAELKAARRPKARKPILTAFTHQPALLAVCQSEYAAFVDRESSRTAKRRASAMWASGKGTPRPKRLAQGAA